MSVWDDIVKAVSGASNAVGGEIKNVVGQGVTDILGPGGINPYGSKYAAGDPLTGVAGASAPTNPTDQTIQNQLKGLTFAQASGSDATSLAKQLTAELQNLPASDAEKIISQVEKQYSGTSLASDLATDVSPPTSTTSPSSSSLYGFDPLSLGKMFETTMAPWLAQQQSLGNKEQTALDSQLKTAIAGASPAYQQALTPTVAAINATQNQLNESTDSALATAPQWDNFVSSLTNAISAAKLAQATAQAEPYFAATTGVGPTPTGTPAQGDVSTLQNMYNSLVAGSH
jgi:hypothetical protein